MKTNTFLHLLGIGLLCLFCCFYVTQLLCFRWRNSAHRNISNRQQKVPLWTKVSPWLFSFFSEAVSSTCKDFFYSTGTTKIIDKLSWSKNQLLKNSAYSTIIHYKWQNIKCSDRPMSMRHLESYIVLECFAFSQAKMASRVQANRISTSKVHQQFHRTKEAAKQVVSIYIFTIITHVHHTAISFCHVIQLIGIIYNSAHRWTFPKCLACDILKCALHGQAHLYWQKHTCACAHCMWMQKKHVLKKKNYFEEHTS